MALKDDTPQDHRAAIESRGNLLAAAVLQVFLRTDFAALSQAEKDDWQTLAQTLETTLDGMADWGDAVGVSQQGSGACKAVP